MNDYRKLQEAARKLLFEDAYNTYSDQDNLRAGTQFQGDEEEDPLVDMPVVVEPQMSTQLSQDQPPIDDPTYVPATAVELGRALNLMAQSLPDSVVEKVYAKFQKFVDEHQVESIEVDEEATSPEDGQLEEARVRVKNQLIVKLLEESWDDFKLGSHYDDDETDAYGNKYDDDDWREPSDEELQRVASGDPTAGEATLADVAAEMGISTSGVKKIEGTALKKLRLSMDQFPGDFDKIRGVALNYMMDTMLDLDLIDEADANAFRKEYGSNPNIDAWPALRHFIWDNFLDNVYKKMLRDAAKQGIPESDIGELTPGLYDRFMDYWNRYPQGRKVKGVLSALQSDA